MSTRPTTNKYNYEAKHQSPAQMPRQIIRRRVSYNRHISTLANQQTSKPTKPELQTTHVTYKCAAKEIHA